VPLFISKSPVNFVLLQGEGTGRLVECHGAMVHKAVGSNLGLQPDSLDLSAVRSLYV